jgi:hypothetical protein
MGRHHRMKFIIVLLLAVGQLAYSQELPVETYGVSGSIENTPGGMIYLAGFSGDRFILRDSIRSNSGSFYFLLDDLDPAGVYRILFSQVAGDVMTENRFIEFIFNRENLEIFVRSGEDGAVAVFGDSPENRVYSEFLAYEIGYEEKIMELYRDLSDTRNSHQYDAIQWQRKAYIDSISEAHPDLYATRLIRAFRSPFIPGSMSHRERIDTLRTCFFNHAAIDDPALMHAPVYTFRILDFLSLYLDKNLPPSEQQQKFREAVDRVMGNTSMDPVLRTFVAEFLLEGFGRPGMEEVQIHLAENYLDETCVSDTGEVIRSRMECFSKMAVGEKAPDFVIRDLKGVNHHLAGMDDAPVLVLFWSSACEHCRELMTELHHWYVHERDKDLEVLSISIDPEEAPFIAYIKELDPGWITARDPLGWIGKIPSDYCIYATPSMFLLDHNLTILAKPVNFRQFIREVKRSG